MCYFFHQNDLMVIFVKGLSLKIEKAILSQSTIMESWALTWKQHFHFVYNAICIQENAILLFINVLHKCLWVKPQGYLIWNSHQMMSSWIWISSHLRLSPFEWKKYREFEDSISEVVLVIFTWIFQKTKLLLGLVSLYHIQMKSPKTIYFP